MMQRRLFLKWLLLQAAAVLFLVGLGVVYGGRIHGASLVAIPIILALFLWATALGGRACWYVADVNMWDFSRHEAKYLNFWAWVCQVVGVMSTILGFWLLLQGNEGAALADAIRDGGGVALSGTFIGVFCSLVLAMEERMIEHDVGA